MGRMGRRGRVVLRRIEERVRRGICFRKRLAGLEKKAEELAVLCDAHVGFIVLSCSDGGLHHFAAPGTIENIMERYENSLAAKKGAHGRRILEKSKSKDFQIPKETTDKGLNNGVMRFIDETDISTLNMDQLSQIERLLEDELRWTRARKLEANIIARSQKKVHGKAAIDESSSTEIPSRKEKKQVDGSQQSGEEVEVVVVSQSPTPATGGGGAPEQRHWTPVDLNIPCRDAGPLQ